MFFLDWQKHQKSVVVKQPSNVSENKKIVYEELKNNILSSAALNEPSEISVENYVEAASSEQSKKMIININKELKKQKAKNNYYNFVLGLELANLKCMFYNVVCDDCVNSVDKYAKLSCGSCGKNKANTSSTRSYFQFCTVELKCTKDWINFLINLARLCKEYPKFKYCTLSLDKIKSNMKLLHDSMKDDYQFWQI